MADKKPDEEKGPVHNIPDPITNNPIETISLPGATAVIQPLDPSTSNHPGDMSKAKADWQPDPKAQWHEPPKSFEHDKWRIARSFRVAEKTYSMGEPIPRDLTQEQIDQNIQMGNLIPVGGDKNSWRGIQKSGSPITQTSDYLRGNDVQVIRAIRQNQPDRDKLASLLEQARRGRSRVLIEVLELLNGVPLER